MTKYGQVKPIGKGELIRVDYGAHYSLNSWILFINIIIIITSSPNHGPSIAITLLYWLVGLLDLPIPTQLGVQESFIRD